MLHVTIKLHTGCKKKEISILLTIRVWGKESKKKKNEKGRKERYKIVR